MGDNLKVVQAKFSILSLLPNKVNVSMHSANSKIENSVQVSSCQLKFVHVRYLTCLYNKKLQLTKSKNDILQNFKNNLFQESIYLKVQTDIKTRTWNIHQKVSNNVQFQSDKSFEYFMVMIYCQTEFIKFYLSAKATSIL